jgi:hypothetical protein
MNRSETNYIEVDVERHEIPFLTCPDSNTFFEAYNRYSVLFDGQESSLILWYLTTRSLSKPETLSRLPGIGNSSMVLRMTLVGNNVFLREAKQVPSTSTRY